MNYLTLESTLIAALRTTTLFAHVAAHTVPPENLQNQYTGGLPAALFRLIDVRWIPVEGETRSYRGLGRVEVSILAPPNQLAPEAWADLIEQTRSVLFSADPTSSATLLEDATTTSPQLQYRILVSYKLTQIVL